MHTIFPTNTHEGSSMRFVTFLSSDRRIVTVRVAPWLARKLAMSFDRCNIHYTVRSAPDHR